MKFLKKASLAAAIAAAPFAAHAGMVALDDASMSDVTGQAGVTIEINIGSSGITVGEIEYIDEGSVLLQNLKISNVTNLTQTIDVDADGNLQLGVTGITGAQVSLGDSGNGLHSAVALKAVSGETTELVNNLDLTFNLGQTDTTIVNLAKASNHSLLSADAIAAGAHTGSVAIVASTSIEITDMNVGAFGYTRAQAETRADASGLTGQARDDLANQLASGSAVQIEGLKFYGTGGVGTAATIDQTIWAKGGTVAQGGGVYIQLGQIEGTLEIGAIKMGNESIGSLKVSDINLAGMTQRIYGH